MKFLVGLKWATVMMILVLVGLPHPAWAWDAAGHMQIADIAWMRLTPQTKREVTSILLSGDPRFRPVSDREADVRDAFRKAATFADVIKSDRTTAYESIIPEMNARFMRDAPIDPNDREADRCKTWHYYDTPIRATGNHPARASNALSALTLARQQLADLEKAPEKDRKMQCWWLYWVEHITGDLHQPLHCAENYQYWPNGDAGGNLFYITDPGRPDGRGRLHGFWDAGISRAIEQEKAQSQSPNVEDVTKRWSGDRSLAPARAEAGNLSVSAWIAEGAKRADSDVYTGIERNGTPSADYISHQTHLCSKLAVLAGARLAASLNLALGK